MYLVNFPLLLVVQQGLEHFSAFTFFWLPEFKKLCTNSFQGKLNTVCNAPPLTLSTSSKPTFIMVQLQYIPLVIINGREKTPKIIKPV
jgi:hypothetical protein